MNNTAKRFLYFFAATLLIIVASFIIYTSYFRRIKLSDSIPEIDEKRQARMLSAFFGLDELPKQSLLLYRKGPGKNGMPIVFSQEIDPTTLDESDFEVTTQSGEKMEVEFVTLKPANEEFELRTVLLIGEYGTHPENPPISVAIVDNLKSRSGQNYKGQNLKVIPLPDGPTISYAEHFIIDEDYPYVKRGGGCDCPKEETDLVVRTVWSGGVKATNGQELGDNELNHFHVTVLNGEDTLVVTPFMLADLRDNDNNIDLCLKTKGTPIYVSADAEIAIDPRGDKNPKTTLEIVSRW